MKKLITILLIYTLVLSSVYCNAFADDAEDFLTRGEACDIIIQAADDYNADIKKDDVMHGDSSGNLNEDSEVTKLEVFIMMNRAFGDYPELEGANKILNTNDDEYADIPEWAQDDMEQSLAAGIADSTDGVNFGINEKVTKTELEKYLRRVYTVFGSNLKDDFYNTINKETLSSLTIAPGYLGAGTLFEAAYTNDKQLNEIVYECANGTFENGTKESKIKNYYNNYIDLDARNALTFDIISDYIEDIENIETMDDFMAVNNRLYDDLCVSYINFDYTIDDMDSNSYTGFLVYPSSSLSKGACTGKNDTEKNAFNKYVKNILMLYGESEEQADADVNRYYETQRKIAEKSLDTADLYDVNNTYNVYTVEQLDDIFSEIDLTELYSLSPYNYFDKILIWQVDEMEEAAKLLTADRIDDLKNYCRVSLIMYVSRFMGEDYIACREQYIKEMYGLDELESLEESAVDQVCSVFSEYIGEIYGDKYCTDEIIADVTEIAEQLIDVYCSRIDNLTWMSDETKEKAKRKLETMSVNIGEPDEYKDYYAGADIKSKEEGGSYFQNTVELNKQLMKVYSEIAKEKVDKTEWSIETQTLNACYDPSKNGIYIPIAFLQYPLYDINFSYEEKLASVGSTIGHELSHAFDSSGAQYDEYGNAVDWWTEEDAVEFEKLCDEIAVYYDNFEWFPGAPVDGELTLIENIADLGGMAALISLAEKTEGFDYDEFFRFYAYQSASVYTRESSLNYSLTDPHSPDNIRVNNVIQQEEKFYETYGIEEGDGMYVAEEDRIGIW